jgi:hypothetical protein
MSEKSPAEKLGEWLARQKIDAKEEATILASALLTNICNNCDSQRDATACFAHICAELLLCIPRVYENLQEDSNGKSAFH